ncbi:MAG: Ig-like domain-containing protein [Erysipelotrichaceae bacterium]|nr:Ig-like domain-containing protein [Erysipelotrichaceae bacterium]
MKRRSFLTVLLSVLLMMAVLPFCSSAHQVQAAGPYVDSDGILYWPGSSSVTYAISAQNTASKTFYLDDVIPSDLSFDLKGALTGKNAPDGIYTVWIDECAEDWEGTNPGGCIYDGNFGRITYSLTKPSFYVDENGIARWNTDFGYSKKAISAHYNGKSYLDNDTSKLIDSYSYDLAGALAAKNAPSGTYDVWLMSYDDIFNMDYIEEATLGHQYQYTALTGIKLSKSTHSIYAGNTSSLAVTLTPADASARNVTWKSSNTSVATVDANGKITAKNPGTTKITATVGNKTATCTITVKLNKPKLINIYNSAKGADVRFQGVTGADSYILWRKYKGTWEKVKTVSAASLEKENGYYKIFDETIRDKYGEGYIYSVAAKKGSVEGAYDTKGLALYRLRAPTITKVTSTQSGKAVVVWTKENCHGYEVQYSLDNGAHWTKATQIKDGSTITQTISGLTSGKKYVFRIRCQKTNKDRGTTWSPYSPWKNVTVK